MLTRPPMQLVNTSRPFYLFCQWSGAMDVTTESQPMRRCSQCGVLLPLTEFRLRRQGSDRRHRDCRECASLYMRLWRAKGRRKAVDAALVRLHRNRESPGNLEHLAAHVMDAFNGAEGFAAAYAEAFDAACDAGDHRAVQRYLMGLADFIWAADFIAARRKRAEEQRKLRRAATQREAMRWEDY